jgi:hypothetical protein
VTNSQIHVFCSNKTQLIFYGRTAYWDSTGYTVIEALIRKYMLKYLTKTVMQHQDNVTINDQTAFLKAEYFGDKETY